MEKWARANSLLLVAAEFEHCWQADGAKGGQENRVWFEPVSQRWFKANAGSFHGNWLEYLHRILLHNWLFPNDAPLRFEGLIMGAHGFEVVVSQPDIKSVCGAERGAVALEMGRLGFVRTVNDDYFNADLGLSVQDLHDENVLVDAEDNLIFLDPMIVLTARYELAGFEFRSGTG